MVHASMSIGWLTDCGQDHIDVSMSGRLSPNILYIGLFECVSLDKKSLFRLDVFLHLGVVIENAG